jgi:hypothetical protein
MSQKFRILFTLLISPVAALLLLIAVVVGESQVAFVFGLWAFILFVAAFLVLFRVHHPLPWRLLGAATIVGAVAYFACGYYFELPLRDRKNGVHVALVGVVGAYFAIMGRISPFLPKAALGDGSGGGPLDEGGSKGVGKPDGKEEGSGVDSD